MTATHPHSAFRLLSTKRSVPFHCVAIRGKASRTMAECFGGRKRRERYQRGHYGSLSGRVPAETSPLFLLRSRLVSGTDSTCLFREDFLRLSWISFRRFSNFWFLWFVTSLILVSKVNHSCSSHAQKWIQIQSSRDPTLTQQRTMVLLSQF